MQKFIYESDQIFVVTLAADREDADDMIYRFTLCLLLEQERP
jgi:hypothetical protein